MFAFSAGCTPRAQLSRSTLLKVNDHQLSAQQFAESLAHGLRKFDALTAKDPVNLARAKDEVVRAFILSSLIIDAAKELQLSVSESELTAAVNEVRSGFPDDIAFRRSLAEENLSFLAWKDRVRQSLVEKKFFEKLREGGDKVSPAEVNAFYESNKPKYLRKERVLLRQIVVDELPKAEELRAELKKRDFGTLASKYSVAPEAKAGGTVGWIEKGTVDIFDKAFNLNAGAISSPLESPYGIHIFKVEKKRPAGTAGLDEVRAEIEKELATRKEQAAFLAWLDKQLRKSVVMKNVQFIDKMTVETRATL